MTTPLPEQLKDKAPLFPSWNYWYALVIFLLVALIVFFFIITNRFA